MKYLFVLGNAFDLCQAELTHVLSFLNHAFTTRKLGQGLLLVETKDALDLGFLIQELGGVIKIASVVKSSETIDAQILVELIRQLNQSRVTFGISVYGRSIPLSSLAHEVKALLINIGIASRYVLPKQKEEKLSSIVVKKGQVTEFLVCFDSQNQDFIIGKTVVVQESEMWAQRDFGRPFADPQRGMLPPKVARMMVNLARNQDRNSYSQFSVQGSKLLLDPFCGMGTILAEALVTGWKVIGSDYSNEVIKKAQKNLEWLTTIYRYIDKSKYKLLVYDATHIAEMIISQSVDAVVTEPFLGAPVEKRDSSLYIKGKKLTRVHIQNTLRGLEKLYIGALKNWFTLLKSNGKVVIAVPEIHFEGQDYRVKKVVDTCEKLGYTLTQGPYAYSRPQAVVKRNIYVFRKVESS